MLKRLVIAVIAVAGVLVVLWLMPRHYKVEVNRGLVLHGEGDAPLRANSGRTRHEGVAGDLVHPDATDVVAYGTFPDSPTYAVLRLSDGEHLLISDAEKITAEVAGVADGFEALQSFHRDLDWAAIRWTEPAFADSREATKRLVIAGVAVIGAILFVIFAGSRGAEEPTADQPPFPPDDNQPTEKSTAR